ncbi:GNAT family N-acetyltransferase [Aneurinibacillus soli]|nr:GNAT family N-acetyltransferase [Aneurinibacillus soli]
MAMAMALWNVRSMLPNLILLHVTRENAAAFLSLTPPDFQPRLRQASAELIAIGAVQNNRPIGVVMAERRISTQSANLLSIFVTPACRRDHIGSHLMRVLEGELVKHGCGRLYVEFMASAKETSPFEVFFQSCGYAPSHPGIHLFRGTPQHLLESSWYVRCRQLPPRFSIATWSSTDTVERAAIRQGEGVWYPPLLSPFVEENAIDPELSLVLRDQNDLVGWLITERMGESALLYKTMFVKKQHQRMGRGLALFAEGIRRMMQIPDLTEALCFVEGTNKPMLQAMRRRIMGPDSQEHILRRTYKNIDSKS